MSLYERYARTVEARLRQLARERERGVTSLLAPLPPVCQEEHDVYGIVVCVACQRDHHVEPGLELTTADGEVLCWACARAGAPMLAALVLADAANHAERAGMDVCEMANGFLIDLIREGGYEDRAADLGQRVVRSRHCCGRPAVAATATRSVGWTPSRGSRASASWPSLAANDAGRRSRSRQAESRPQWP